MHTVALSSQPREESYSIQKITHRQRQREWQRVTLAGGVWEYITVNAVFARIMIVFSWKTTQDPLGFRFTLNASTYASLWHSVGCRHAHTREQGSFLASTGGIKPSGLQLLPPQPLLHTRVHTSKSLSCMTGDAQKQIMVIDRCLEMDLCVFMRVRTEDWD